MDFLAKAAVTPFFGAPAPLAMLPTLFLERQRVYWRELRLSGRWPGGTGQASSPPRAQSTLVSSVSITHGHPGCPCIWVSASPSAWNASHPFHPLCSPLPSECLPLPSLKMSQTACPGLPPLCLPLYRHVPQGLVLTPFVPLPHLPGHPQEQGRSHFLCAQNIKTLKESWLVNSWGEQAVSHLPLLS